MRQRIFSPPLQLVAGWSRRSGERVQDLLGKLGAANRTEAVARARGTRFWLIPDAPLAIF
jgi:hypothetical protein